MSHLVSVVIPNYRHARYLRRRVDSVLCQSVKDIQVILLDDCSPDNSLEILRSYLVDPRVSLHVNQVNSGSPFAQWNKGASLATGKYLWIAESDDFADPEFLATLVPLMESVPESAFCFTDSWVIDSEERRLGRASERFHYLNSDRWSRDWVAFGKDECAGFLSQTNTVPNASAVLIRRSRYVEVGGANANFRIAGDWDLWVRLCAGYKVGYLSQPLNFWRQHVQTVRSGSLDQETRINETLSVIEAAFDLGEPKSELRRAVRVSMLRYILGHCVHRNLSLQATTQALKRLTKMGSTLPVELVLAALAVLKQRLSNQI